jgi:hypothetical protein
MNRGARLFGSFVVGVVMLAVESGSSRAADTEAIAAQMTAQNKAAITAYSDGDFDKAKSHLMAAVKLAGKDPALKTHPMTARTYVHLGVLYVDGYEDKAAGVKYFVKALKIRPDIEVTEALATKSVKAAFEEASHDTSGGDSGETAVAEKSEKPAKPDKATAKATAAEEKAAAKATAAEEKAAAKTAAVEEKAAAKAAAAEEKAAREQAAKAAAETKQREKETAAEKDKLMKELAATGSNEAKERGAKEKALGEKAATEKQLAEANETLRQAAADKD